MKRFIMATSIAIASVFAMSAQAAETSTKIVFAKDSYCGSFSGDLYDGKTFRIWLQPNQELIVRNVGDDQVNTAYVQGPSGRLSGDSYENSTVYYTDTKGNHYIKVYGNTHYSKVEFCAY